MAANKTKNVHFYKDAQNMMLSEKSDAEKLQYILNIVKKSEQHIHELENYVDNQTVEMFSSIWDEYSMLLEIKKINYINNLKDFKAFRRVSIEIATDDGEVPRYIYRLNVFLKSDEDDYFDALNKVEELLHKETVDG